MSRATLFIGLALLLGGWAAQAEEPEETVETEAPEDNGSDGYSPSEAVAHETLRLTGYVDVGFAVAGGNGSSFAAGDTRIPADYGVDAFAPAVNARGEVASTDSRGVFVNGFLPRSVGIGNRPSFLLNTASADLRFSPSAVPVLIFVRAQLMPRTGDASRVELQQAFGRVSPFSAHELALSLGKFDSVFGIEYLENEANLRTGITPSLIARYTTGQALGLKAFYRVQLAPLWSAVSLNAAATASGTRIEALVDPHRSLTGVPVGSGRLGYELNLQKLQARLGVSGLIGPRNDQRNREVKQLAIGGDLRLSLFGFNLAAELVRMIDEPGRQRGKTTPQGEFELASGFEVLGGYLTAAWTVPVSGGILDHLTIYARYDHRRAAFEGFGPVEVNRITAGLRVDLFGQLAIKAEYLVNGELAGAPHVSNDVFTSSAVFTW